MRIMMMKIYCVGDYIDSQTFRYGMLGITVVCIPIKTVVAETERAGISYQ